MTFAPEALLVAAVIGVGILHTIVPDHWVPIALIARQNGWSRRETAEAAFKAGTGHVVSTLIIALVVWIAGVAFATRFGQYVSIASSVALIGFGAWIAVGALREIRGGHEHRHDHGFEHAHDDDNSTGAHGGNGRQIQTSVGTFSLFIFENGTLPRFRVTGPEFGTLSVETERDDGSRETFTLQNLGPYWEALESIPEPHQFNAFLTLTAAGRTETHSLRFEEGAGYDHAGADPHHDHDRDDVDVLYKPLRTASVALTHAHAHRHGTAQPHAHRHDHDEATWHREAPECETHPPSHEHGHKTSSRTALLLILGSSPMVEGIPAFFAAGKYGPGLIAVMAAAFAISTIATYVALCVYSSAGLQRVRLGSFEKYGEVISGAFIALVGFFFLYVPVL